MTEETFKLLETIYKQVSGEYREKIVKIEKITKPLIEGGDLIENDVKEFIKLIELSEDEFIRTVISEKSLPFSNMIKMIYLYFRKYLTEEYALKELSYLKMIYKKDALVIDKFILGIQSKNEDKSISTGAKLDLIKIAREQKKEQNNYASQTSSCSPGSSQSYC